MDTNHDPSRRFFIDLDSNLSSPPVPHPDPHHIQPLLSSYNPLFDLDLATFLGTTSIEPTTSLLSTDYSMSTSETPACKRVSLRDKNGFLEGSAFFDPSSIVFSSSPLTAEVTSSQDKNAIFDLDPSTWAVKPCSASSEHTSFSVPPHDSRKPRHIKPASSIFEDLPSPVLPYKPPTSYSPPKHFLTHSSSQSPSKHLLLSSITSPVLVPFVSDTSDPIPVTLKASAIHNKHVSNSLWTNPSVNRRVRSTSLTQGISPTSHYARQTNVKEFHGLSHIDENQNPTSSLSLPESPVDPNHFMLHFVPLRKNVLGTGLHAVVYQGTYVAHKGGLEHACAVKVLNPDSEESQFSGLLEAALLNLCAHPNIVRAIELVDIANYPSTATSLPSHWQRLCLSNLPYPPLPAFLTCSFINSIPFMHASNLSTTLPTVHHEYKSEPSMSLQYNSSSSPCHSTSSLFNMPITTSSGTKSLSTIPSVPPLPHTLPLLKSPEYVLVLELCQGGSLWAYLEKYPNTIGRRRWMRWARQLAQAIAHMHRQRIVHHDIKPQNILLDEFLGIKLSDLGGSEAVPAQGYFPATVGKGTIAFMAPELVNQKQYNSSIDIYALGLTLFVVGILGHEPFMGCTNSVQLLMAVSRGFWNWPSNIPDPHSHSRVADFGLDPDTRGLNPGSQLRKGVTHPNAPNRLIRFLNGDLVDVGIWQLLLRCLNPDCETRPTALEMVSELRRLDGVEVDVSEL